MTTRARSFWTISGIGTVILYRDRARSPGRHINSASLHKTLERPEKIISQT
jgi:hypothetical protein